MEGLKRWWVTNGILNYKHGAPRSFRSGAAPYSTATDGWKIEQPGGTCRYPLQFNAGLILEAKEMALYGHVRTGLSMK